MNTIEMISRIQRGQKAKAIGWDLEVISKDGIIVTKNGESRKFVGTYLPLSSLVINEYKWKLEVKEIGITQAYKMLEDGLEVKLYTPHDKTLITITTLKQMISVEDFVYGKWYDARELHSIDDLEWS